MPTDKNSPPPTIRLATDGGKAVGANTPPPTGRAVHTPSGETDWKLYLWNIDTAHTPKVSSEYLQSVISKQAQFYGGGKGGNMTDGSDDKVDLKIALSEQRIETRLAEIRGDMQLNKQEILSAIGALPSKRELFGWYTTILAISLAIVALTYAAISVTQDKYLAYLSKESTSFSQPDNDGAR